MTVKRFIFLAQFCLGNNIKEMIRTRSKEEAVYEECERTILLCTDWKIWEKSLSGNPPKKFLGEISDPCHFCRLWKNKQNDVIFSLATCLHVRRRGKKMLNKWKKHAG